MGKPMKSRILGIVLALCMLGAVFAAFPVSGAVHYTGSVVTTDNAGAPKTTFFRGDPVYVNAELKEDGVPYDGYVRVALVRTTDGWTASSYYDWTDDPDVGWNNGSVSGHSLWTGAGFTGELMTYDVVLTYGGQEIARTPITVTNLGLTLSPDSDMYYPGEEVQITFVTTHTTDVFYVQIVNETGATMANWTGQVALTGFWTALWTIAADFPDGDFMLYVRDASSHAAWASTDITVQKYAMLADADRNGYLPGETAKITYVVFDVATMTPYTAVVIEYSAWWLNNSGNDTWLNGTLGMSSGVQEFVIPADIALYSNVYITYWANESTTRSYETTVTLYVGLMSTSVSLWAGPYMPGDDVYVYVQAYAYGYGLPNALVDIKVERNGTAIAAYGADDIATDMNGQVTHSFKLAADAAEGSYIVNITVSKLSYTANRLANFNVRWDGDLMLSLDKAYYYSGDVVTMTFRTIWNNQDVVGKSVAYIVYASYGVMTTGSTSTDTAQFTIPTDYFGWIEVEATVNVDGYMLEDDEGADVYFANIILTPQNDKYKQGDTIKFDFQILTSLTTGTLAWQIFDDDGVLVASGAPAFAMSGSFSYTVPSTNPSPNYYAEIKMTTSTGAVRTANAWVSIIEDYQLSIWVGKSGYASGEFKPGQTVSIHYSINVYTYDHLPAYRIELYNSWDDTTTTVLVTEPSGTIDWKVPKDAPSSWMTIWADLYDPVTGAHLWEDGTVFDVNNQLSAWDRSVGGMSAIDFTLLVLIVIMILLLIIVPFLKGRMGAPKAESAPPPAEPPKP